MNKKFSYKLILKWTGTKVDCEVAPFIAWWPALHEQASLRHVFSEEVATKVHSRSITADNCETEG